MRNFVMQTSGLAAAFGSSHARLSLGKTIQSNAVSSRERVNLTLFLVVLYICSRIRGTKPSNDIKFFRKEELYVAAN